MAGDVQKEWYRQRIAAIHDRVSVYDVLRLNGVEVSQIGDDKQEQISCPFHGIDNKPSARVYPDQGDSRSHVWCFVCQEPHWDAIGLWQKFNDVPFARALTGIEREFNLPTPERPEGVVRQVEKSKAEERFKRYYVACESRLLSCKPVYKKLGDLTGYLKAGSVLDRTRWYVDEGRWDHEKGSMILEKLLDRIREKVRECPEE